MIIPFLSRFFKSLNFLIPCFQRACRHSTMVRWLASVFFYDLIGIIGQFLIFKKISLLWHTQLFVTTPTRK